MKKKLLVLFLVVVWAVALTSLVLTGCSVGTVRYTSVMPTVYEAELHKVESSGNNYDYFVIQRNETIGDQKYQVFYGKYRTSETGDEQEWFCVRGENQTEWDSYLWSSTKQQWEKANIGDTFAEVERVAMSASYQNGDGIELKKTDLVKKTDAYLEYNYGGNYPDRLRVSNNDYHLCLYYGYNTDGEITSYNKFRKFTFDESTTAIPHLENFSLAA